MNDNGQHEIHRVQVRRLRNYSIWLAVAWTALIAASFLLGYRQQQEETLIISLAQARAALAKDLLYRSWAESYGGVYAPVTEKNQPTPTSPICRSGTSAPLPASASPSSIPRP